MLSRNSRGTPTILFTLCLFIMIIDVSAICGDGILELATEQCDDGNTARYDGCNSACQLENTNQWFCSPLTEGSKTICCDKLTNPLTQEPTCSCANAQQPDRTLGYYITSACQLADINECNNNPCHPNAICVNHNSVENCLLTYQCESLSPIPSQNAIATLTLLTPSRYMSGRTSWERRDLMQFECVQNEVQGDYSGPGNAKG